MLEFTLGDDIDDQIYLLYVDPQSTCNQQKQASTDWGQFKFKHALSRIDFKTMLSADEFKAEGNYRITFNSMKITVDNHATTRRLNLRTGSWEDPVSTRATEESTKREYLFENIGLVFTNETDEDENKDQSVLKDKYLIWFPNESGTPATGTLTISSTVEIKNPDTGKYDDKYETTKDVKFSVQLEQGMGYSVKFVNNLTAVKFEAVIPEKWEQNNEREEIFEPNTWTVTLGASNGLDQQGCFDNDETIDQKYYKVKLNEEEKKWLFTFPEEEPYLESGYDLKRW